MRDGMPGPGWWIASDGRWYPPELHPDMRASAAVALAESKPATALTDEHPTSPFDIHHDLPNGTATVLAPERSTNGERRHRTCAHRFETPTHSPEPQRSRPGNALRHHRRRGARRRPYGAATIPPRARTRRRHPLGDRLPGGGKRLASIARHQRRHDRHCGSRAAGAHDIRRDRGATNGCIIIIVDDTSGRGDIAGQHCLGGDYGLDDHVPSEHDADNDRGQGHAACRVRVRLGEGQLSRRRQPHRRSRHDDPRRRLLRSAHARGVLLGRYPDPTFDATKISNYANDTCLTQFAPYVGVDYARSRYQYLHIVPTQESWTRDNDRDVVCVAFEEDATITGSIAGRAQ